MALPPENLCTVELDCAQLNGSGNLVNSADNVPKQAPNLDLILNQHESSVEVSDPILDYIRKYLLEEDDDENISGYHEEVALWEMEKPFYEVLGGTNPSQDKEIYANNRIIDQTQGSVTGTSEDQATEKCIKERLRIDENLLVNEFQRGVEEGLKFLPTIHKLTVDLQVSGLSSDSEKKINKTVVDLQLEVEDEDDFWSINRSKLKKNLTNAESDSSEGGNRKKHMICYEETIGSDMFDKVLLDHGESCDKEEVSELRTIMRNSLAGKKIQDEHIDLNTLLINCSEAVAVNNRKVAEELLSEIRKRSSLTGSGTQRLASVLADALEARLAGSGSELNRQLAAKRIATADIIKAYHLFITAAPFFRVSYYFANANILAAIQNARKVHIVDLGIVFGFQWPPLIQYLASRQGGALKLRITGVDFPQPGFQPSNRVDEVGKRLEDYAKSFNICFVYRGIASPWESICIEDLNIHEDEFLIVNSMYQFRRVRNEVSTTDSARDRVLNLIWRIKPQLFIQGVLNATFSPFFNTRFGQVLRFYSTVFDIFDSLILRDNKERQLMEREFFAPAIINTISCEGSDWLERPETYKEWHLRNVRAGFEQQPLDPGVLNECIKKLSYGYDKRFFIEEDGNWMLQGWKGRIRYALSTWKPKADS